MITMTYYRVYGKTTPFTTEMEQTVGCYTNKQTAEKVANLIREINMNELPAGIDVYCDLYKGNVERISEGYCIKDQHTGCIRLILEKLDRKEYQRLVNLTFTFKEKPTIYLKFGKES